MHGAAPRVLSRLRVRDAGVKVAPICPSEAYAFAHKRKQSLALMSQSSIWRHQLTLALIAALSAHTLYLHARSALAAMASATARTVDVAKRLRCLVCDDNLILLNLQSMLLKRRFSHVLDGPPIAVDGGLKAIQALRQEGKSLQKARAA